MPYVTLLHNYGYCYFLPLALLFSHFLYEDDCLHWCTQWDSIRQGLLRGQAMAELVEAVGPMALHGSVPVEQGA